MIKAVPARPGSRWSLTTDETEPAALRELAYGCPLETVTYEPAP
jgi:hypothetical protein